MSLFLSLSLSSFLISLVLSFSLSFFLSFSCSLSLFLPSPFISFSLISFSCPLLFLAFSLGLLLTLILSYCISKEIRKEPKETALTSSRRRCSVLDGRWRSGRRSRNRNGRGRGDHFGLEERRDKGSICSSLPLSLPLFALPLFL